MSVLKAEGVHFDQEGHADPEQRLTVPELGELIGITVASDVDRQEETAEDKEAFIGELAIRHSPLTVHGVIDVMNAWERLGGSLTFGSAQEVSCFLQARTGPTRPKHIWPLTIYPSGSVEVVFQHLAVRPPFDEPELREELRDRLNQARGIELAEDRLERRPSFDVELLADQTTRQSVIDALEWFMGELDRYDMEMTEETVA